jgi:hypothetical protein
VSRSIVRPRSLLTAGALALALGAVCSTTAFAVASPTLHDGRVLARGAAAEFGITLKCPEGWAGQVQLSVLQVVENRKFASGGVYLPVSECTGKKQRFTVAAQANHASPEDHPFRAGPASVSGMFQFVDAEAEPASGPYLPMVGPLYRGEQQRYEVQNVKGVVDLR